MLRLRAWMIRKLGIKHCGNFGGWYIENTDEREIAERWCYKPLGHSDSCKFDLNYSLPDNQPNALFRQRCKGW
jgi:hypothetical protein